MTEQKPRHAPVLFEESMQWLRVRPGATVVGCTVGLAGPEGHLIGFDRDAEALDLAKGRLDEVCRELGSQAPRVTLIGEAFSSIDRKSTRLNSSHLGISY